MPEILGNCEKVDIQDLKQSPSLQRGLRQSLNESQSLAGEKGPGSEVSQTTANIRAVIPSQLMAIKIARESGHMLLNLNRRIMKLQQ